MRRRKEEWQGISPSSSRAVWIAFIASSVIILSNAALREVASQNENKRWVSFPDFEQKIDEVPRKRIDSVKIPVSSREEITFSISLPGMFLSDEEMDDGKRYTRVTSTAGGETEVGKPDIPVFRKWMLIPNGTTPQIEIQPGAPLFFENLDISPVQPPLPDIKDAPKPPFAKDTKIYSTDANYPGIFAKLDPRTMRGQQCGIISIYPYQYNPVERKLSVYTNLTVTIRFVGRIKPIPRRLRSKSFDALFRRLAVNADVVLNAEEEIPEE